MRPLDLPRARILIRLHAMRWPCASRRTRPSRCTLHSPDMPVLMQGINERAGRTHALQSYSGTSVIQLQNVI